ncbi:hypothetical protein EIP91_005490 [Steccherinum ochraceum]|uniref:Uncharacterized protein n=1 Tax=Steccherinum ochraceum TaxID=92696 RepID=A0A4R0S457_9APHY|nr:hypothetical protein EIP91_005490 [Steccherinum ochraceum]
MDLNDQALQQYNQLSLAKKAEVDQACLQDAILGAINDVVCYCKDYEYAFTHQKYFRDHDEDAKVPSELGLTDRFLVNMAARFKHPKAGKLMMNFSRNERENGHDFNWTYEIGDVAFQVFFQAKCAKWYAKEGGYYADFMYKYVHSWVRSIALTNAHFRGTDETPQWKKLYNYIYNQMLIPRAGKVVFLGIYIVYSAMNIYFIPVGKLADLSTSEKELFNESTKFNNAMIYSMVAEGSADVVDTKGHSLFQRDQAMEGIINEEIVRRAVEEQAKQNGGLGGLSHGGDIMMAVMGPGKYVDSTARLTGNGAALGERMMAVMGSHLSRSGGAAPNK